MLTGVVTPLPVEKLEAEIAFDWSAIYPYGALPLDHVQGVWGFVILNALMLIIVSMYIEGWLRWNRGVNNDTGFNSLHHKHSNDGHRNSHSRKGSRAEKRLLQVGT